MLSLRFFLLVVSVGVLSQAQSPNTQSDPISPLITFLQQLQRLRSLYTTATQGNNEVIPSTLLTSSGGGTVPRQENSSANLPIQSNDIASTTTNTDGDNTVNNRQPATSIFERIRNSNNRNTLNGIIQNLRSATFDRFFRVGVGNVGNSNNGGQQRNFISALFNRNN